MTKNPKSSATAVSIVDAHHQRPTKIGAVVALLQRAEGATLSEITQATGWQKHTARAALTGLKKKGHTVGKAADDGMIRYTIAAAARS